MWGIKPWMEDKFQQKRKKKLLDANRNFDRMTNTNFIQYVNRANTEKPIY